jgi:hypothetical protein
LRWEPRSRHGKAIIPVLSNDVDPSDIPTLRRTRQWVRESTPAEAGEKIARAVEAAETG